MYTPASIKPYNLHPVLISILELASPHKAVSVQLLPQFINEMLWLVSLAARVECFEF